MKVFLDSNILLDVALEREPFYPDSIAVMKWCADHASSTVVAWHTITNTFYLLRKPLGKEQAAQILSEMLIWIDLAPASKSLAVRGLSSQGKDFEDTLQYLCAEAAGADVLITRNPKDFLESPVEVKAPRDFLQGVDAH